MPPFLRPAWQAQATSVASESPPPKAKPKAVPMPKEAKDGGFTKKTGWKRSVEGGFCWATWFNIDFCCFGGFGQVGMEETWNGWKCEKTKIEKLHDGGGTWWLYADFAGSFGTIFFGCQELPSKEQNQASRGAPVQGAGLFLGNKKTWHPKKRENRHEVFFCLSPKVKHVLIDNIIYII